LSEIEPRQLEDVVKQDLVVQHDGIRVITFSLEILEKSFGLNQGDYSPVEETDEHEET
jgi:hypothetical protein